MSVVRRCTCPRTTLRIRPRHHFRPPGRHDGAVAADRRVGNLPRSGSAGLDLPRLATRKLQHCRVLLRSYRGGSFGRVSLPDCRGMLDSSIVGQRHYDIARSTQKILQDYKSLQDDAVRRFHFFSSVLVCSVLMPEIP